jgi:putative transposase
MEPGDPVLRLPGKRSAHHLHTNAIEALNAKLRRAVRARGHFPSDDAATKLLYLVLNRAAEDWKRPPREGCEAKTQFAVMFGERFVNG